ncbi:RING/U-box [Glarea lozoyensis ATCC 20868]|uniref:RING/U-box n=1 Tax=Glarea lozoyensis (strain ATCC 20868 / MF5171) TaxID=1116229 RepID=S3D8Y8_GLAL2|nr:RING/U-box [Glarea lozoyensis ATCC 20868]EPE34927.1 RING/U-box [Glarea lozoyensis ATCC 20868]
MENLAQVNKRDVAPPAAPVSRPRPLLAGIVERFHPRRLIAPIRRIQRDAQLQVEAHNRMVNNPAEMNANARAGNVPNNHQIFPNIIDLTGDENGMIGNENDIVDLDSPDSENGGRRKSPRKADVGQPSGPRNDRFNVSPGPVLASPAASMGSADEFGMAPFQPGWEGNFIHDDAFDDPAMAQAMMDDIAAGTKTHGFQEGWMQSGGRADDFGEGPSNLPMGDSGIESRTNVMVTLLSFFPGICQDYISELYESIAPSSERIIAHILDQTEKGKPFPKSKDKQKNLKRKRDVEVEADDEAKAMAKYAAADRAPPALFGRARGYTRKILAAEFGHTPMSFIDKVLSTNRNHLFPSYAELLKAETNTDDQKPAYEKLRYRRIMPKEWEDQEIQTYINAVTSEAAMVELYRELQAARKVRAMAEFKRVAERELVLAEEANELRAREDGTMLECGTCCADYPMNRMVHCNAEALHWFCKACALKTAETQIGMSKYELCCMSTDNCEGGFSKSEKEKYLDEKTIVALDRIEQEAVLRMAGIENLVNCPFCPFAAEMPPVEINKEFDCHAPECGKISCRLCKLESHIPKSCEEHAKETGMSVRREVEEAMSAAIIRKCNKCGTPFLKEEGCNKMTCTRNGCGNVQCYICSKSCTYNHFNDKSRGGKDGNCPLFDSANQRHEREIQEAEKAALDRIRQEHPELTESDLKIKVSQAVLQDEEIRRSREPRYRPAEHRPVEGQPNRLEIELLMELGNPRQGHHWAVNNVPDENDLPARPPAPNNLDNEGYGVHRTMRERLAALRRNAAPNQFRIGRLDRKGLGGNDLQDNLPDDLRPRDALGEFERYLFRTGLNSPFEGPAAAAVLPAGPSPDNLRDVYRQCHIAGPGGPAWPATARPQPVDVRPRIQVPRELEDRILRFLRDQKIFEDHGKPNDKRALGHLERACNLIKAKLEALRAEAETARIAKMEGEGDAHEERVAGKGKAANVGLGGLLAGRMGQGEGSGLGKEKDDGSLRGDANAAPNILQACIQEASRVRDEEDQHQREFLRVQELGARDELVRQRIFQAAIDDAREAEQHFREPQDNFEGRLQRLRDAQQRHLIQAEAARVLYGGGHVNPAVLGMLDGPPRMGERARHTVFARPDGPILLNMNKPVPPPAPKPQFAAPSVIDPPPPYAEVPEQMGGPVQQPSHNNHGSYILERMAMADRQRAVEHLAQIERQRQEAGRVASERQGQRDGGDTGEGRSGASERQREHAERPTGFVLWQQWEQRQREERERQEEQRIHLGEHIDAERDRALDRAEAWERVRVLRREREERVRAQNEERQRIAAVESDRVDREVRVGQNRVFGDRGEGERDRGMNGSAMNRPSSTSNPPNLNAATPNAASSSSTTARSIPGFQLTMTRTRTVIQNQAESSRVQRVEGPSTPGPSMLTAGLAAAAMNRPGSMSGPSASAMSRPVSISGPSPINGPSTPNAASNTRTTTTTQSIPGFQLTMTRSSTRIQNDPSRAQREAAARIQREETARAQREEAARIQRQTDERSREIERVRAADAARVQREQAARSQREQAAARVVREARVARREVGRGFGGFGGGRCA